MDTESNGNGHTHSDPDGNLDPKSYGHLDFDSDGNGHAERNADRNGNGNIGGLQDLGSDSDPSTGPNADPNANADTDPDGNFYARTLLCQIRFGRVCTAGRWGDRDLNASF